MNAKKIMGAVLVALLAAALFVGAGAAADLGTYFPSQTTGNSLTDGTWTYGSNQVVVKNNVIQAYSVVAGTYTNGDNTSYFTNPTATYQANGTTSTGIVYPVVNGGNLYQNDGFNLTISPLAEVGATNMLVTYPNGSVLNVTADALNVDDLALGTYKVVAIFDKGDFVAEMDDDLLFDTLNSFTFNVVKAEEATITASVDTAFSGEIITVDVVGKPGAEYSFNLTNVDIALNQYIKVEDTGNDATYSFNMSNSGKATFQLKVNSSSDNQAVPETDSKTAIIQLIYDGDVVDDGEIKIKISAPVVTATLGAQSYFITQNITVTGTSTAEIQSGDFTFNLSGTNIDEFTLFEGDDSQYNGKNWEADLYYTKKLDVGTYTIKIYQGTDVVATVPVALKQPFISIIEAPEVVVQNTDAVFLINAEAAADVKAYFFGTNFYYVASDIQQKNKDALNEFTVTVPKSKTNNMSAGQYFVVFQHPMYDKVFNIVGQSTGGFYLNTSGEAGGANAANETFLFNATERQTANAAQALCDALDTQNVDDMYVKYSFFIVGEDESFTISDIPATVAQGETLTISGVSTANAGKFVTVEMISTAFAAVPKETVGSASFIAVSTKVAEDGTWEITMDTSDLNVDEYSLSVACSGEDKPWKNVKINVVEAADEPVDPEQPGDEPGDEPEEPVAPETPGFGALAALAGLGAVAVLLLRRE